VNVAVNTTPHLPGPLWLIGCGNMAGAMLEGWLARGLDPALITVVRPSGTQAAPNVRTLTTLPEGEVPALVLLGVKPQKLDAVAPALARVLDPATILISILAGTELASLRQRFPTPRTIIRAMPNTPVRLNQGATSLLSDSTDSAARATVETLMRSLGAAEWIEDEALFDVATALAGSGPAFLFRFIDALAKGGEALGLPADQAHRLAIATVQGTASLAAASPETPHALAERVASPGGMTRKGLDVLDADAALDRLVAGTLAAAVARAREMAADARAG